MIGPVAVDLDIDRAVTESPWPFDYGISDSYGCSRIRDISLQISSGPDPLHRRAVGLRQVDPAAHGRRPGAARGRERSCMVGAPPEGLPEPADLHLSGLCLLPWRSVRATSRWCWRTTASAARPARGDHRRRAGAHQADGFRARRCPSSSPGGMKQRVAIARALAVKPGGDADGRAAVGAGQPDARAA